MRAWETVGTKFNILAWPHASSFDKASRNRPRIRLLQSTRTKIDTMGNSGNKVGAELHKKKIPLPSSKTRPIMRPWWGRERKRGRESVRDREIRCVYFCQSDRSDRLTNWPLDFVLFSNGRNCGFWQWQWWMITITTMIEWRWSSHIWCTILIIRRVNPISSHLEIFYSA